MDIEITVKFVVKDMFDDKDLKDYFGKGKPATIKEAAEDMLSDNSIFDYIDDYDKDMSIVEIRKIN